MTLVELGSFIYCTNIPLTGAQLPSVPLQLVVCSTLLYLVQTRLYTQKTTNQKKRKYMLEKYWMGEQYNKITLLRRRF